MGDVGDVGGVVGDTAGEELGGRVAVDAVGVGAGVVQAANEMSSKPKAMKRTRVNTNILINPPKYFTSLSTDSHTFCGI